MTATNANIKASQALYIIAVLFIAAYALAHITGLWGFVTLRTSSAQAITINIGCIVFSALLLLVGRGVHARHGWARICATVISIALLAAFPIGTAIALYLLIQLVLRWEPVSTSPSEP